MAKKKNNQNNDNNLGRRIIDDYIRNHNERRGITDLNGINDNGVSYSSPFVESSRSLFESNMDNYDENDYDDFDEDYIGDSCDCEFNGIESLLDIIEENNFVSNEEKENIKNKILEAVQERVLRLRTITAGDVIFIPDDYKGKSGHNEIVISIGMYCDCCGSRYKDIETGEFVDEIEGMEIFNLHKWKAVTLDGEMGFAMHSFDSLVFRNAQIVRHVDGVEALNKWDD